MLRKKKMQRPLVGASFPLQLFLIINHLYCPFWGLLTLALLIFKAVNLYFPKGALAGEIIGVFLLYFVHYFSCALGKRGNLTEQLATLLVGGILQIVAAVGAIYYMWLQTYVMRLDLGFSATMLALDGAAFIFTIVAVQNVASSGIMGGVAGAQLGAQVGMAPSAPPSGPAPGSAAVSGQAPQQPQSQTPPPAAAAVAAPPTASQ